MIDSIVSALLLYFLYRGWAKGFLRTLIGPISLIVACIAGIIYYSSTHNIMAGILIGVLGPILLNILFSISINIWHQTVNVNRPLSYASRLLGSGFSLVWGSLHLALMIILLFMIPLDFPWLRHLREQVLLSRSYAVIQQQTKTILPVKSLNAPQLLEMLRDPAHLEEVHSLEEYKTLMEEKVIMDILSDEDILRYIEDKNFSQLMTNPKVQSLLENPEVLRKVFDLNIKIIEQSALEEKEEEVKPRWLEAE